MRTAICLLVLLAAVGGVLAQDLPSPRDMTFEPVTFNPPEPVRFEMPNGIVVYFLEDHQLPVVTFRAAFRGGTVADPADTIGLTQLTATLMRSGGAGDRSADHIDEELDFLGASIESYAALEQCVVDMRCLRRDLDSVLAIFADIVLRPGFDSAKVALEKSNLMDEIRRQNDHPGQVTRRLFYQTVYTGHPYGYYATLESADRIDRAALVARHGRGYTPTNCWLAVSGDLSETDLRALLNRHFGDWTATGAAPSIPAEAEIAYEPGVYYAFKDINQANIRLGHLSLTDRNPDRYAFEVVNFALGNGFTSRITKQVRTTAGLAYSAGTWLSQRRYGSAFFGYCQTEAGNMSAATRMILDIIEGVRVDGITDEEMKLAKESIVNSFVFNATTPRQIVNAQAGLEVDGFPAEQLQRDLEAYRAVTLEDCRRVAARYLHPDQMVIVVVGNAELFDAPAGEFGPVTEISLEPR